MIQELKSTLKELLFAQDNVIAAWEGGAAATGFLDQYSDLDLEIVLLKGDTNDIFALLETLFQQRWGILKRFRMPEPSWHGMSQCFYLLDKMPPCFYCDIAVVMAENPRKFTEPDRHGHAVVWFDKTGIYSAAPTPAEDIEALGSRMFHIATDHDWLSIMELKKALARKNWIAAQMNYMMFINRHLVPLLNLKHRSAKADFGIRYAERDYPPEDAETLSALLKISSLEDIEARFPIALELFEELKNRAIGLKTGGS